jgi:hypothetical protein
MLLAVFLLASTAWSASADAAGESPWWHASTRMYPSNLAPGGEATTVLEATNVGDASTSGLLTISETLPPGLSIKKVDYYALEFNKGKLNLTIPAPFFCEHSESRAQCHFFGGVNPYEDLEMRVTVKDEGASPSGLQMHGEVSGGEAPTATVSQAIPVSSAAPAFGVEHFAVVPEEEGGSVDVRAGSHPFQLTSTLTLNESANQARPPALPREVQIKLPPGFVGNASTMAQCSDADFKAIVHGSVSVNLCPDDTVVGVASVTIFEPSLLELTTVPVPVFNLEPQRGEPARFGFEVGQTPAILDTSLRTGGDYGVTVSTHLITELAAFISANVTFWGVPGDPRHDYQRGWKCLIGGTWYESESPPACVPAAQSQPAPLLTLPTACEPFRATVEGSSWPNQAAPEGLSLGQTRYGLLDEFGRELGIGGCHGLRFEPTLAVAPEVHRASSPTGLDVRLHTPESTYESASGLAEAAVKDISVSLPAGVAVNPASAGGLEACSEAAVGYIPGGKSEPLRFAPVLPQRWEEGIGFCPTAAKIGTVEVVSRLLPAGQHLKGGVYLAAQNANPFGSLLAMYLIAEDPISGIAVKLAGEVAPDLQTGQLVTTFREMPQVPFEDATLHLFGGARAPLTTPPLCGTYRAAASATPWSDGVAAAPTSDFTISSGSNRAPCPAARGFTPTLGAAPASLQAGVFSGLSTTISREDGSQDLQSVTLHMPPGFSGMLTGVKLCGTAQAEAGTCGAESLIGHTTVSVGVGNEPFKVTGGQVFLTEGYGGAPFGLSIVTQAKAGPFDLGLVVVRARVEVDPHTAQLTVTTDSSGPYAIPHIIKGIPLAIKHVEVTIDRAGFTFNPTNCNPLALTGVVGSDEGASSQVSIPFQVANCATLGFAPKLSVSTTGRTSIRQGASLKAKLTMPGGPQGTQANLAAVAVQLPKQLPSRLTTLQKACPAATFAANPASCPAGSAVGSARVLTPALPVPLTGPAYLVSHGGEAFPSLTLVLQGYGITLDEVGTTLIRKGITSTKFNTVPDVPFSSFELTLPQGRFSALAVYGSLCKSKLLMPTVFYGQNGAVLRQSPRVQVTGCAKPKPVRKKGRKKHHH